MPDIDATNTNTTTPEVRTMPIVTSIPATAVIPATDTRPERVIRVELRHIDGIADATPNVGQYVPLPDGGELFACSSPNCDDENLTGECYRARVALATYVVGPVATTGVMDAALAVLRQQPIPVGTLVKFGPPRDFNGSEYAHGVIVEARPHGDNVGSHADYRIATLLPCGDTIRSTRSNGGAFGEWVGPIASDSVWTDAARIVAEETPTPVEVRPATVLPRTASDATERADALERLGAYVPNAGELATQLRSLARWLDGGELMSTGHSHAADANLCGEYESLVCPVFGWTPRRGHTSSKARLVGAFDAAMAAHEAENASGEPADVIASWLARYERGGIVNRATCEHIETHLESHKIGGVNDLLADVLDWETVETSRDYVITIGVSAPVTIVRTVSIDGTEVESDSETVTATQTVTVYRSGSSADDASENVDSDDVHGALDADEWYIEDLGTTVTLYPSRVSLDWDIEDVTED